jgi:hypothetical protein
MESSSWNCRIVAASGATPTMMEHCAPLLLEELEILKPTLVSLMV